MKDLLAKVRFGSILYGTSVPESDVDYRAVRLPSAADCFLDKVKHAYEDKSEEDTSVFTLQHFCRLALEGQSIAIELLAAPPAMVVITSPVWQTLQANRRRFYTKSMRSFLGYAKTQAGKYSARVDRLGEVEVVLKYLNHVPLYATPAKLADVWDGLPQSINAVCSESGEQARRQEGIRGLWPRAASDRDGRACYGCDLSHP